MKTKSLFYNQVMYQIIETGRYPMRVVAVIRATSDLLAVRRAKKLGFSAPEYTVLLKGV